MKKTLTILCIILSISLIGCGKIDSDNTSSNTNQSSSTNITENNNESDNTDGTSSNNENSQNNNSNDNNLEESPSEEPETDVVEEFTLSEDTPYSGSEHSVKILGLKEFKSLKSELYTDKAKKGKKFLVLFLAIANTSTKDEYINVNYLSAKVDGKEIENTFLVNEPKSYTTIFTDISAGGRKAGFIVWEVPSNWKKFEMTYDGWKDAYNISIKSKFTPKDLSNPPIYSERVLY